MIQNALARSMSQTCFCYRQSSSKPSDLEYLDYLLRCSMVQHQKEPSDSSRIISYKEGTHGLDLKSKIGVTCGIISLVFLFHHTRVLCAITTAAFKFA